MLGDLNPGCLTPEAVFLTTVRYISRAIRMEGQVGQCGSTFNEAEGKGWDFPWEDPSWGIPVPPELVYHVARWAVRTWIYVFGQEVDLQTCPELG